MKPLIRALVLCWSLPGSSIRDTNDDDDDDEAVQITAVWSLSPLRRLLQSDVNELNWTELNWNVARLVQLRCTDCTKPSNWRFSSVRGSVHCTKWVQFGSVQFSSFCTRLYTRLSHAAGSQARNESRSLSLSRFLSLSGTSVIPCVVLFTGASGCQHWLAENTKSNVFHWQKNVDFSTVVSTIESFNTVK